MAVECPSCHSKFKNNHGLSRHRVTCKQARSSNVRLSDGIQRATAVKVARRLAEDVAEERRRQDEELIPTGLDTLSMDVDIDLPDPPEVYRPPPTTSGRQRRFPCRYEDFLPSQLRPLPHMPEPPHPIQNIPLPDPPDPPQPQSPSPPSEDSHSPTETEPNEFGLYRVYENVPSHDPDEAISLDSVTDTIPQHSVPRTNVFGPFLNATIFRLMDWFYNGSLTKSVANIQNLVDNVLLAEDFKLDELQGFHATKSLKDLDEYEDSNTAEFAAKDGWTKGSVKIRLPAEKVKHTLELHAPEFEVGGIWYRKLTQIIVSTCQQPDSINFHLAPFKLFQKSTDGTPPERIYSEVYNTDAFISEHNKIQSEHCNDQPALENVVAALMPYSDSTHLTNFGTASLWPIYLFFGNVSKYIRSKPTSFSANHVAYIPTLPDMIQDVYRDLFGKSATAAVLTQLKRDLMHAIWELLLDPEFMHAYEHGIIIKFWDGILRRVFPRFFLYSCDYPEKVLLALIRSLARCPCPHCMVLKDQISQIGTKLDMRRRGNTRVDNKPRQEKVEATRGWIYEKGYAVNSKAVDRMLVNDSLVPVRNAFSRRLLPFGVNFFSFFVPDLLHEFELGVWKATFIHLMRILYASGGDAIQKLNWRYRQVPTFSCDTIRKFSNNASGMKKLAARDFEDLLQCAIPVFEGLLPPPHNETVLDVLFTLSTWHALAKLRLHTESTLVFFESITSAVGHILRRFSQTVCQAFSTYELPSEEAARGRRTAAKASSGKGKAPAGGGAKPRVFNMATYKLHALGDYVSAIRSFGTTENFTTQVGELEHKRVKKFYTRTNKMRTFTEQIAKHQRRQETLRKISLCMQQPPTDNDTFDSEDPSRHHHISREGDPENITRFLVDNSGDPAIRDFLPKLQDHLLARILGDSNIDPSQFTDEDRATISFTNNRIFRHKVLRINYTTYDMRRSQDTLNPRIPNHANVMVLSQEDDNEATPHPYWYARIIGIFHVLVRHRSPSSTSTDAQQMDFLWVRWYGRDLGYRAGWKAKRLHRVRFMDANDPDAFGFINPKDVIRSSHLIPAFAYGCRSDLLGPSPLARQPSENDEDWVYLYINLFVDRDMFMRYYGGSIGHKGSSAVSGFEHETGVNEDLSSGENSDEEDDVPTGDEEDAEEQPDGSLEGNAIVEPGGAEDLEDDELYNYGYAGNDDDEEEEDEIGLSRDVLDEAGFAPL